MGKKQHHSLVSEQYSALHADNTVCGVPQYTL